VDRGEILRLSRSRVPVGYRATMAAMTARVTPAAAHKYPVSLASFDGPALCSMGTLRQRASKQRGRSDVSSLREVDRAVPLPRLREPAPSFCQFFDCFSDTPTSANFKRPLRLLPGLALGAQPDFTGAALGERPESRARFTRFHRIMSRRSDRQETGTYVVLPSRGEPPA
jgi:hypothetical protein